MVDFNPENRPIIRPNADFTNSINTCSPNSNTSSTVPNSILVNNQVPTNTQNLNSIYTTNPQTTTQTQPEQPNEQPFIKTGESLSERLDRYYSGRYSTGNLEQKRELLRRYMTGHFQTLTNRTREERVRIQLADYRKLLSNTENPEDYRVLANQIEILESQNQVPGARSAREQARNPEFRRNAEIGIAEVISDCEPENRSELTSMIVNTDNFEAYAAGLNNLTNIHNRQQVELYEIYSTKVSQNANIYKKQTRIEFQNYQNETAQGPLTQDVTERFSPFEWATMSQEERNNIQNITMNNDGNIRLNALNNGVNSPDSNYAEAFGSFGWKIQPEFQQEASNIITGTRNDAVINAAAETTALYAPENQAQVHSNFWNAGTLETQHILTQLLGQYHKDAQLPIYQLTMTSEYQEILNFAASNIYTLHPDNQYTATQYTIDTGNEEAINYAAQYAYLCNEEVRDAIKNLLYNSGYDSVKYTLANSDSDETAKNSSSSTSITNSKEFKAAKVSQKIKILNELNKTNQKNTLKEILKNANNAEKLAIISQLPQNLLSSVLELILEDSPSMEILAKVTTVLGELDYTGKNDLMKKMLEGSSASIIIDKAALLDTESQKVFVETMADKGRLSDIDTNSLSFLARNRYEHLREA